MVMPLLGSARRSAGLLVAASVVAVDQVTKVVATHDPSRTLMPEHNPAYALGVVTGPAPVLIIVSVVVLCAFVVMVDGWASRLRISVVLPALVAGGIVGNLIDRIRFGSVRDFLVTPWAIINFADIAIAVGVVGILIALVVHAPRPRALSRSVNAG
jgi:signal peptidase II